MADTGDDPDLTLRHADMALYRAKRAGRARTVTYETGFGNGRSDEGAPGG